MNTFFTFLLIGIATGAIYAVAATGLVMTYITSGIFNFAHGAVGMFLAFIYYSLRVEQGWPTPVALAVVLLVVAPIIGVFMDVLLMRRLAGASVATKLVVTLAVLVAFQGLALSIWGIESRSLPGVFGTGTFTISGLVINHNQVANVVIAAGAAIGLRLLFRRTRLGVAMRAVVDNPELTSVMGVNPRRVTAFSWAMGSMLAGLAAILIAPGLNLDINLLSLLVVTAYAAAIVGRLQSVALTFVGALVLGIGESMILGYLPQTNEIVRSLKPAMPFIFLFVMLLVRPDTRLPERVKTHAEPRPPSLATTLFLAGAASLLAATLSGQLSDFQLLIGSSGLVFAGVAISLVLLTGLSGQVSLTQMAFAGVGAVVMGKIGDDVPSLVALVLAGAAAGIAGAIVSLPAIRLRGVYMALATLASALLFEKMLFGNRRVLGGGSTLSVPRPEIFGISFQSERAMFVILTVAVALFAVLFLAVRRSDFGLFLSAMRDSPAAAATIGLNLAAVRLKVFTLSAFIAGVIGALLGGLQSRVGSTDFTYGRSLSLVLVTAVFGITSVSGALGGALFFVVLPELLGNSDSSVGLQPLIIGLLAVATARHPEGLSGQLRNRLRPLWTRGARPARRTVARALRPDDVAPVRADAPPPKDVRVDAAT